MAEVTRIADLIQVLEDWAPPALQESYDNAGLIVGDKHAACSGVLVCLDSTEAVVDEAIAKGCNLIVAHHPIVFSGLKSFTGRTYIERVIVKAIKHDVAIYAIHTNLDNVLSGVNAKIGQKLGIEQARILVPKKDTLQKLIVYCPNEHRSKVLNAMFDAGAGQIGKYDSCSFSAAGQGTFRAGAGAKPYVGEVGKVHEEGESRMEVVVAKHQASSVVRAMIEAHPYEEVAFDLVNLSNAHNQIGAGMIGDLDAEMPIQDFLNQVKQAFNLEVIRYTTSKSSEVKTVAWCGGSGSFLLGAARAQNADVFITGDFKYHQFFDGEHDIVIADIGHYESEIFTVELIVEKLKEKFANFALHLTQENTNPVKYLK